MRCIKALAVALTLLGGSTAAQAQALRDYGRADPITGWLTYCQASAADCSVDLNEPSAIALTKTISKTLAAINRRVNAKILAVSDLDHWGVSDRWELPSDGMGDCEDFQLLKRHLLIQAGLPRRALLMTVVIDQRGDGHAVLMVRTTQGDLILDNQHDAVLLWSETRHVYVKREGQDGREWVSLGGQTASPPMTSAAPTEPE